MSMIGQVLMTQKEEVEYAEKVLADALGSPRMPLRTAAFHAADAIKRFKAGDVEFNVVVEGIGYKYQNEIRELKCTPYDEDGKEQPTFYSEVLVKKGAPFDVAAVEFRKKPSPIGASAVLVEPGRDSKQSSRVLVQY